MHWHEVGRWRRSAAVSKTSRSNVLYATGLGNSLGLLVATLLRLGFTTAALRQSGSAMPWNHFKLWTGRKNFVSPLACFHV